MVLPYCSLWYWMYSCTDIDSSLPPICADSVSASRGSSSCNWYRQCLCFWGLLMLWGMVALGEKSGTYRLLSPVRVVVVLEQPSCRSLACCPASGAAMSGEGAWGLGPRDWTVRLGEQSLTSWSSWCWWCLCLRELLRLLGMGGFGEWKGTCRLLGLMGSGSGKACLLDPCMLAG